MGQCKRENETKGDIVFTRANLEGALESYRKRHNIAERLASNGPTNTRPWGDPPTALSSYKKSLEIREELATHDPANVQWQHDLSVILEKIGNVQAVRAIWTTPSAPIKIAIAQAIRASGAQNIELPAETVAAYQSTLQLTQKIFSSYYNRVQDMISHDMCRTFPGTAK